MMRGANGRGLLAPLQLSNSDDAEAFSTWGS
jgi:hypothetical protein